MDITGKIKLIREEQSFSSGFTKREFVITSEDRYPQDISFELLKEKETKANKKLNDLERKIQIAEIKQEKCHICWNIQKKICIQIKMLIAIH